MQIRSTYNKSQMTLALTINNGSDIVLGADSMAIEEFADGRRKVHMDKKKVLHIDDHSAVAMAGRFDTGVVGLFIDYFIRDTKNLQLDIQTLFHVLTDKATILPPFMQNRDALELLLAGFDRASLPQVYEIKIDQSGVMADLSGRPYNLIGYKGPRLYTESKLEPIVPTLYQRSAQDLEQIASDRIVDSIDKFPDLLGGNHRTIVLHRPK